MVAQTLFSEEVTVTSWAEVTRQLVRRKVGTFCLVTGGTFLALAGVMSVVIVFVTGLAVKAEVFGSEEPWDGITSMVMVSHFDEDDLLVLRRTLENNLIVVIHGKDHDLVVSEMTLKRVKFGYSTSSLGFTP